MRLHISGENVLTMAAQFAIFSPAADQQGRHSTGQQPFKDALPLRRGRVKWFDAAKGYGFIEDEQGQEVFVHFTAIQGDRFRTLEPGSEVYFASVRGEKGPKAVKVIKAIEPK